MTNIDLLGLLPISNVQSLHCPQLDQFVYFGNTYWIKFIHFFVNKEIYSHNSMLNETNDWSSSISLTLFNVTL